MKRYTLIIVLLFSFFEISFSEENKSSSFNISDLIMGHIKDAHDFHILDYNGHSISLPLPVILYTERGIVCFSSNKFHHDNEAKIKVENTGQYFVKLNEKIYYANEISNEYGQYISLDDSNNILNKKVLDISITKNVFSMFISIILLFIIFISISKMYRRVGIEQKPKGLGSFLEPIITFIVYDVIKTNIGDKKYLKYTPFLLTIFFFILINNIIGLIPFFPFSSNLTGNIAFTFVLAFISLIVTVFSGSKSYWSHIFATPGVPKLLLPIMVPIELIGVLTKPFSLMIRLFANITAGHIVILSLVSLIFLLKTLFVSPVSVFFVVFMNILEILVAFIQAYIFTMLTSMFIGQAVDEGH